jgi:hypothetical protein
MCNFTFNRAGTARVLGIMTVLLVTVASGCRTSSAPPKAPKVRIEGPPGTLLGYTVSYFDGKEDIDITATAKTIPESGVYAEDLKGGHQGVVVQVIPNSSASITVILYDGEREIQRAKAHGSSETAQVQAGKVNAIGPFRRP